MMTGSDDNARARTVIPSSAPPVEPLSTAPTPPPTETSSLDRSVYVKVARALLPRWLRIIGPSPWYYGGVERRLWTGGDAAAMHGQLAAALAIAVLTEVDPPRPDQPYLRECVRAALLRWQLALHGDGRPSTGRSRRDPLHAAIAASVVHLLTETSGFQTESLLDDLARHLRWLAGRPPDEPWLEAALIGAMVDGAVLVRDANLLTHARCRIEALLRRQDEEGWFPECGGPDVGLLSLTVDALARVDRQIGWPELKQPLAQALSFMAYFVEPDGRAGGCYNTCRTAFVSPFGVELLAPHVPQAAALARACRQRYATLPRDQLIHDSDTVYAVLGAAATLAAAVAEPVLPHTPPDPSETTGPVRFSHAGLFVTATSSYHAVVSWKNGGALYVVWRDGPSPLVDAGVVVVHTRGARSTYGFGPTAYVDLSESSITCGDVLRRVTPAAGAPPRRIDGLTPLSNSPGRTDGSPPDGSDRPPWGRRSLTHDRWARRVIFETDAVRIEDWVEVRLPCEAVVLQSPALASGGILAEATCTDPAARVPIFVGGGRRVSVTRVYRAGELVELRRE